MAVFANIISTFDPRGLNNARKSFAGLASDSLSAGRKSQLAMKLVGGAAATAAVSVGAFAVKLGIDGVRAAIDDEKSLKNLKRTLDNVGQGFRQTSVENFITKMQFATGVADSALRPALNQLLLATGDVDKSQRLLNLSLDISASTGRDLESVTIALSKASLGNFTALKRLGIPLDENIIKTKDLEGATSALENTFKGAAATAATTLSGKIAILSQRVDEAKEGIGYDLIKAIELATGTLNSSNGLADAITNTADAVGDFVVGLGYLAGQVDLTVEDTNRLTSALQNTGQAILINLIGPIFAALPALKTLFDFVGDKGNDIKNSAQFVIAQNEHMLSYAQTLGTTAKKTKELTGETVEDTKALKRAEEQLRKTQDAAKKLAQDGIDALEVSLNSASDSLDNTKDKFNDFRDAISGTITGILDFGAAAEGENFLKGLTDQAADATKFADKVKTLIQLGLSERAIREVLNAGFEAGTNIADQIIAGGATVVTQVNTLVSAVDDLATIVGVTGAETFYGVGVAQGQAIVDGITATLNAAKTSYDALLASFAAPAAVVATGQPPTPTVLKKTTSKTVAGTSLTQAEVNKILGDPVAQQSAARYQAMANAKRFANGGIVLGATNAIIGEAGPEAVIPLSGRNGGMGQTFNIVVNAGVGTNGAQVGAQIVEAIKKFERTSGQVFARA